MLVYQPASDGQGDGENPGRVKTRRLVAGVTPSEVRCNSSSTQTTYPHLWRRGNWNECVRKGRHYRERVHSVHAPLLLRHREWQLSIDCPDDLVYRVHSDCPGAVDNGTCPWLRIDETPQEEHPLAVLQRGFSLESST